MPAKLREQISRYKIPIRPVAAFFAPMALCCVILAIVVTNKSDADKLGELWYEYPETWIVIGFGLFVSSLIAFLVQRNRELMSVQECLEEMTRIDPLTGIPNHRHFMEVARSQLHYAARNRQGCFVILSDVDCFRSIIDAYGHGAGDAVLVGVAERIKEIIRPYDLFARHDGGEFILLAVDANRKGVDGLLSRIRLGLCRTPFHSGNTAIPVTVGFGMARIAPGASLEDAVARAKEALRDAKREGRNGIVCHDDDPAPAPQESEQASPKRKAQRKSAVGSPAGSPSF